MKVELERLREAWQAKVDNSTSRRAANKHLLKHQGSGLLHVDSSPLPERSVINASDVPGRLGTHRTSPSSFRGAASSEWSPGDGLDAGGSSACSDNRRRTREQTSGSHALKGRSVPLTAPSWAVVIEFRPSPL
ncbi:unnamed protein product [Lampetra planeri]